MKPIALLAALLIALQVLPQRQQMGQVVVQAPPKSPNGVAEPLAVLNAERAWSNADAFWLLMEAAETEDARRTTTKLERDHLRRYAIRAIGRVEDPAQVRRLLALKDEPFTPVAEAIAQSLHGFDPQNAPQLLADVVTALQTAVKGLPGTTRTDRMFRTANLSRAMSQIAYGSEPQLAAMESLLRDALSLSTTSALPSFREAYLTIVHAFEALGRVNTKLVHYDDETIEWLEKAAKGETIHGEWPYGRFYALPWLKDFDPVVARRAADIISRLAGRPATAQPTEAPHIPTQPFANLNQCVIVNMASGKPFLMRMDPADAPITVEQFLQLAIVDHYYDGLTIHRLVPNFVLQGGSPGANEYSGNKEFWRDEIGGSNLRGSVGLSIRGRNTGDAQFYINLLDNPRLDGGYTVFAHVIDMDVVDRLQEGDVMRSIRAAGCPSRQ